MILVNVITYRQIIFPIVLTDRFLDMSIYIVNNHFKVVANCNIKCGSSSHVHVHHWFTFTLKHTKKQGCMIKLYHAICFDSTLY